MSRNNININQNLEISSSVCYNKYKEGDKMKTNKVLLTLPSILFPYLVLLAPVTLFFSTKSPIFRFIMEKLFFGNIWIMVAALLAFGLIAAVLDLICVYLSIREKRSALSVAKTAMIVKLCQIPAFIAIFILGAILTITIFTIPFTIALFLFDCATLFLSGILTAAAVINAFRCEDLSRNEAFLCIASQFIFCIDVIGAIVLFSLLKKRAS